MMKTGRLLTIMVTSIVSFTALAQVESSNIPVIENKDLQTLDQDKGASASNKKIQINNITNVNGTSSAGSSSGANAQQSQKSDNLQVELINKTTALKDVRRNEELNTELRMQEEIEKSRLSDERARAQRLFGDKFGSPSVSTAPAIQTQTAQQQSTTVTTTGAETVVVAPVQNVEEKQKIVEVIDTSVEEKQKKDDLKNEIISEMKAQEAASIKTEVVVEKKEDDRKQMRGYVGALVGTSGYPELYNVEADVSAGATLGTRINDNVYLEATLIYSRLYLDKSYWASGYYGLWDRINQYNMTVAVKYALSRSAFQPYVGGVVGYTRRVYSQIDPYSIPGGADAQDYANSNSWDFGGLLGADFAITNNLAIAADFRYMLNLTSNNDSAFLDRSYRSYDNSQSIEESQFYTFTVGLKLTF